MEPAREAPWAEHEKVFLLAEIVKTSLPSHVLFSIIRDYNIQPRWNDIPLPYGRSLRSSQMAFNDIVAHHTGQEPRPRHQLPAPIHYPGQEIPKKRPLAPETSFTPIGGRLLQPRPPQPYSGEFLGGPSYIPPMADNNPNKKKRGRPTKAEAQERALAAAARGEPYPPPRKSRPTGSAGSAGSIMAGESQSVEPASGEPTRAGATPPQPPPTPLAGAVTPQHAQPEQGSESSSGKRRRTKPTPLELEKSQREPSETESPLAFGPTSGDASRMQAYSAYTPISAPLPSSASTRDRDVRMEGAEESQPTTATPHSLGIEESQPRTTTPRSFKDTVGI